VPPRELSFPRFRSPNLSLIVLLFPPPPSLCHCIFYSRFNLILFSIAAISACETVLLAARGEEVALFGSLSLKRERERRDKGQCSSYARLLFPHRGTSLDISRRDRGRRHRHRGSNSSSDSPGYSVTSNVLVRISSAWGRPGILLKGVTNNQVSAHYRSKSPRCR